VGTGTDRSGEVQDDERDDQEAGERDGEPADSAWRGSGIDLGAAIIFDVAIQ
jgi:hypothetical protein